MRKRIYEVIELSRDGDKLSAVYDSAMMLLIMLSLVPLVFKETTPLLNAIDRICVGVFIVDYLLRLATADYKMGKPGLHSFMRYPFTFMALVDLLSILPSLTVLNGGFKLLRILRMSRAFRVLRVLRAFRYSRSLRIIADVLRRSKDYLLAPAALYELTGDVPDVVFPCAALTEGDKVCVYYGAADTCVGIAFGRISEILDWLKKQ